MAYAYGCQTKKETALIRWFSAYDLLATKPGASSYNTCFIYVPFRHRLVRAHLSCTDIDNVGAISATLKGALDGAAKAGSTIGTALSDTVLASTTDTEEGYEFELAAADQVERGPTRYYVILTGDNAGDHIEEPVLVLGVLPTGTKRV